jgi:hypothetical protein
MWRSLVAHLTGGQGVAGSNPVIPTNFLPVRLHRGSSRQSAGTSEQLPNPLHSFPKSRVLQWRLSGRSTVICLQRTNKTNGETHSGDRWSFAPLAEWDRVFAVLSASGGHLFVDGEELTNLQKFVETTAREPDDVP